MEIGLMLLIADISEDILIYKMILNFLEAIRMVH